jgi:hypothetical protein
MSALESSDRSQATERPHPAHEQLARDNQVGRSFNQDQKPGTGGHEALPTANVDEKNGVISFVRADSNVGASSSNPEIKMPGGAVPLFEKPGANVTPQNFVQDGKLPLSDGKVVNLNVMSVSKSEMDLPGGARLDTTFNWQSLTMADGTRLNLDNLNFKELTGTNPENPNYAPIATPSNSAHGLPLLINGRDGAGGINSESNYTGNEAGRGRGFEVTLKGDKGNTAPSGKPGEFPSEYGYGAHELSNGGKLTLQKSEKGEGYPDKAIYTPPPGSRQVEVAFDSKGVLSVGDKVLREQEPQNQQLYDQLTKNWEQANNYQGKPQEKGSQSSSQDYGYKPINGDVSSRLPGEAPLNYSFRPADFVRAHEQLHNANVTLDSPTSDEAFLLRKEQDLKNANGGQLSERDHASILQQTIDRTPGRGHLADSTQGSGAVQQPLPAALKGQISGGGLVQASGKPSNGQRETLSNMAEDISNGNMRRLGQDTDTINWKSMTGTYAPALQQAFDKSGYNVGISASSQEATKGDLYIYTKPGIDQCSGGTAITANGPKAASFDNRDGQIVGPGGEVLKDGSKLPTFTSADLSWSNRAGLGKPASSVISTDGKYLHIPALEDDASRLGDMR